jgi:hypothetical protein
MKPSLALSSVLLTHREQNSHVWPQLRVQAQAAPCMINTLLAECTEQHAAILSCLVTTVGLRQRLMPHCQVHHMHNAALVSMHIAYARQLMR